MKKALKIGGLLLGAAVLLLILWFVFTLLWWSGALNPFFPREVASCASPDGAYTLTYYQLGDAEFPFGKTDIRLTLRTAAGKKLASVDDFIQDDGAAAWEGNLARIEWGEHGVTVTLTASEMEDKDITLKYNRK